MNGKSVTGYELVCAVVLWVGLLGSGYADSDTLGQVEFAPAGKIEKAAGVWVDGAYVGRVSEIKVMLVPGEHRIAICHPGYRDLTSTVAIEPETAVTLPVRLENDPKAPAAEHSSQMKIIAKPSRAAVFLNDAYVGRVSEFDGLGQGMILPPGTYSVRIALPGYRTFETQITLLPAQKFQLKADLSRQ